MMQKIQRFGGAMLTPVLVFAFAGVVIGFSTLFTNAQIFGSLASPESLWFQFWTMIQSGGWTVFNQMPLLFVVGLPIGLAKKQSGRACMEALVVYLTFNYFLSSILGQWGPIFGVNYSVEAGSGTGLAMIAGIKTLDMGMMGAILISGITVYLHNRYFDKELPDFLGIFGGSCFIIILGFAVMIPMSFGAAFLWPKVQQAILGIQGFMLNAGNIGVWVYTFLERLLIPTGLHHFIYAPFSYDNVIVQGGLNPYWAKHIPEFVTAMEPLKELYPGGGFMLTGMSKVFGMPGVALAFYATAKKSKKGKVAGLLIPVTLTAIVCGVTEPIEYTFLFIAPILFAVHAVLAASLSTLTYMLGIVGNFTGGLIEWSAYNYIPLFSTQTFMYVKQIILGLGFTAIYFFVFRYLILRFDLKTPGREDDDSETKLVSKAEYRESKGSKKEDLAKAILIGLGGKENIKDVTNCASRLRVNVYDDSKVKDTEYFTDCGARGLVHKGNAIQIIIGLNVPHVRDEFENLL